MGVSAVTGAVMNMVAWASERTSERMQRAPLVGGAAMNCALSRPQQHGQNTRSRHAVAWKWPRLTRLREVKASWGATPALGMLQTHMEKR